MALGVGALLLIFTSIALGVAPSKYPGIKGPQINPLERVPFPEEEKKATRALAPSLVQENYTQGIHHCLIILVDFPGIEVIGDGSPRINPGKYTPEYYERLLLSEDPHDNILSMREYFLEVSYNTCYLKGKVTRWYTSAYPYHYWGKDSKSGEKDEASGKINRLAREVIIELADPEIDFSVYDKDRNHYLTPDELHLIIIHAGEGQEETGDTNDIWSHRWNLGRWETTNDGVKVAYYTMQSETSGMGIFAHELFHDLGVPDLYNTISGSGESTIGVFCVMDRGSWCGETTQDASRPTHPCGWVKFFLGWLKPKEVIAKALFITLKPIEETPSCWTIIENPAGCDWTFEYGGTGEYFLLEYRKQTGFDKSLPGEGLLIWHIDESRLDNNIASRRLVDLEEADGKEGEATYSGDFWLKGEFSDNTKPNSKLYDGSPSGVIVKEISVSEREVKAFVQAPVRLFTKMFSYPNPFIIPKYQRIKIKYEPNDIGEALKRGEVPVFKIYTLTGRLVRVLNEEDREVYWREMYAVWDGKNEAGELVASGVYFYLARSQYQRRIGKLTLVR
jgi:immune inhibitor A